MKRVCVIFPPNYREFTRPDILIGRVSGYFAKKNIPHDVYDLNIRWIRYLLSLEGLSLLKKYCEEQFMQLDQKAKLSGAEQKKYSSLMWISSISLSNLQEEAVKYAFLFRNSGFYSLDSLLRANRFLTDLINAANMILDRHGIASFYSSAFICEIKEQKGFRQAYYEEVVSGWSEYEQFVVLVASEAQLLDAFLILHKIKEYNSKATCILAGHVIGILWDVFPPELTCDFDYAVTGEIENAISLVLEGRKLLNEIPDLFIRMPDGTLQQTEAFQTVLQDRNISYETVDWSLYLSPVRCVPFSMTFGCCWAKCTFCNLHVSAKYYREYDAGRSVDMIQDLALHEKTNLFVFTDEALTPHLLDRLTDELIGRSIAIFWAAQTRFSDDLTFELFRKMHEAGCRHLEFGLESADSYVQFHMRKGISNMTAAKNLSDAHRAGLVTTVNLITGYPCREDYTKTRQFLEENSQSIDRVNNFAFYITKGSGLEVNNLKYGIRVNHNKENDLQVTFSDYTSDQGASRQTIEEQVHQIDSYISRQGGRMEASLCPVLEYSVYYDTTDAAEIVDRSRSAKRPVKTFTETDPVKLKKGVMSASFHYDPVLIKKQFSKSIAWMDKAKKLEPVISKEHVDLILDTVDNIAYPETEVLQWITEELAANEMTFGELAKAYSATHHKTEEASIRYLNSLNIIYHIIQ